MRDTGFTVQPAARARRAGTYGFDAAGRLVARRDGPGGSFLPERPDHLTFEFGRAGPLVHARRLPDVRAPVPGRRRRGWRAPAPPRDLRGVHVGPPERGSAHGRPHLRDAGVRHRPRLRLGVAVVIDPATAAPSLCWGAVGTVGWPGAFGGWWQADPVDQSVLVFLAHNLVEPEQLARGIGLGVFGAIAQFHALATTTA